MKLPIRSVLVIALGATLCSHQAQAAHSESVNESVAVGSGAVIGASVAGPIGLVVGAAIGGYVSETKKQASHLHSSNQILHDNAQKSDHQLRDSLRKLAQLEQQLETAQLQVQSLNAQVDQALLDKSVIDGLQLDVLFGTNDVELSDSDRKRLRELSELLKNLPDAQVKIAGFADERGDSAYNDTLSLDRAYAVADVLSMLGVSTRQMRTFAYGASRTTAETGDLDAYSRDRRVSIELQLSPRIESPASHDVERSAAR